MVRYEIPGIVGVFPASQNCKSLLFKFYGQTLVLHLSFRALICCIAFCPATGSDLMRANSYAGEGLCIYGGMGQGQGTITDPGLAEFISQRAGTINTQSDGLSEMIP